MVKTVCLIEYPEQWEALRRGNFPRDGSLELYCASRETEDALRLGGVSYRPLTEDIFSNQWDGINRWARETALRWGREPRWAGILQTNGICLGDALYRPISHRLVHLVRRRLILDHLFRVTDVRSALVFRERSGPSQGTGGAEPGSVNELFLKELLSKNIGHGTVEFALSPAPSKTGWREYVRPVLTRLYAAVVSPRKEIAVIGMGSVSHLADVLEGLARKERACFIDENFQAAARRQCKARKIPYYVHDMFLSASDKKKLWQEVQRCLKGLGDQRNQLEADPAFEYERTRLEGAAEAVLEVFRKHGYRALERAAVTRKLFQERRACLYLAHEDADVCRASALSASALGKKAAILSHGIPPIPPADPVDIEGISPSVTFVNSPFEKEKYLIAGYAEGQIAVTGLPRYDAISRMSRTAGVKTTDSPAILYCPHHLSAGDRIKKGYLGIRTPGAVTRGHAIAMMKACREIGARLWIKLHYADDIETWKALVREHGAEATRLLSHDENIFRLIQECDAVASTFSTVTIEALLFGKPALTLNFSGREDLHPYAEKGIALGVYREEDLAEALRQAVADPGIRQKLREGRETQKAYFGGFEDGRNTERVLQRLREMR